MPVDILADGHDELFQVMKDSAPDSLIGQITESRQVFADLPGYDLALTTTGQCAFPGSTSLETCLVDFAPSEKKEWWLLLSISSLGGAGCR